MTIKSIKPTKQKITLKTKPAEVFPTNEDEFPYGWRKVAETLPDGRIVYTRIPLSQADFLDPQEGDQLIQASKHARLTYSIFSMLDNYYLNKPDVEVFTDLKMRWGIPYLEEPAPDIAIVPNINNKGMSRSSFDVQKEGTRPCLLIEIVSPTYPGDDTNKVDIYRQAQIAEYIIIDPQSGEDEIECKVWGYRLLDGHYHPIKTNKHGQLLSQTTGILFELDETKQWIKLTDAKTSKHLLSANEEMIARQKAEAYAAELEARLKALEEKEEYNENK